MTRDPTSCISSFSIVLKVSQSAYGNMRSSREQEAFGRDELGHAHKTTNHNGLQGGRVCNLVVVLKREDAEGCPEP